MADHWHCRVLRQADSPVPMVVCEREALLDKIERLENLGDTLALALMVTGATVESTGMVLDLWRAERERD